ncbi:hypothetical protein QTJ16_006892 [Diplocarpon rosae]|uniref:MARVEL domain-containing protein n=1 Tax=Diplocarpon rosae TaxID=946125 RepID=A0AAD9SUA0_9HELO|nr:hypothetical protein QTJ16_006892 [Diplocarpon rosae]
MLFGIFFAFWRFMEIITLIPCMGMLAYFVHIYDEANALTPDDILVLFIVSVLALAWAIATLFTYHRSRNNSQFVAFVDLLFVGAFIGGVYTLRYIADQNCSNVTVGSPHTISFGDLGSATVNGVKVAADKQCMMKKACFAFGIMNTIFFFITSVLAFFHGTNGDSRRKDVYVRETTHVRRRSGSHRSHKSHRSHSGRRHAYV